MLQARLLSHMHFFHPLAVLERQRKRCLKSSVPQQLLPLLQQPEWKRSTRLLDVEFLVLDFETTGLDNSSDHILSMGWVIVRNGKIQLDSACRIDVIADRRIKPEAAVVNHIVSENRREAISIRAAMQQLITAMTGRVILAHCAPIERGFFYRYCQREFNVNFVTLLWLDTMQIEKSLLHGIRGQWTDDLQLTAVRARYGLPTYPSHDALVDALATAELFLVQIKQVFGSLEPCLGPMAERS